jgi:hypothetical protein
MRRLPLHKKVNKIKTSMPWEIHPNLSITIHSFNWMKETIINQEKEIAKLKNAIHESLSPYEKWKLNQKLEEINNDN